MFTSDFTGEFFVMFGNYFKIQVVKGTGVDILYHYERNKQANFIEDEEVYTKYIPNIYVMNKGNVIGQGSHEQLIESCSLYKSLVNSQGKIRGDAYDVC